MYTIREFAKKHINIGVFARFVLFLSSIDYIIYRRFLQTIIYPYSERGIKIPVS